MEIFLDSANIDEIKEITKLKIIDGVTTNPSSLAKVNSDINSVISNICNIASGPVSVEVVASDSQDMIIQGKNLAKISDNIVIKLPINWEGIVACAELTDKGYKTNMTLCFSINQALAAAKAGATYISVFIGRIEDITYNGINILEQTISLIKKHEFKSKILAASIRNNYHFAEAVRIGTDSITAPANVIKNLLDHPLSNIGIEKFLSDWKKSKKTLI